MQNISFALTTQQFLDRTKDVTRRNGWAKLKPGDRLQACQKCQGLKLGEHPVKLGVIEIISNRSERLDAITQDDVRREGFPKWTPAQFIAFYCQHNKVKPSKKINRLEFKHID